MNSTLPALPPDENHNVALLGVYWVPFAVSVVIITLRFYVRASTRQLGKDDWWMLAAWIDYLVFLAVATGIIAHGGARHIFYIDPKELPLVLELSQIVQPFSIFSSALAKTSVTFLWTRLLNPTDKTRRYILWANLAVVWALTIAGSITVFARCSPPSLLWNGTPAQMAAQCIDPFAFTDVEITVGSYSAFSDLFLAVFPISIIWNLKLDLAKRVGVCALLGVGIFTAACAIVKTYYLPKLATTQDPTWDDFGTFLWASLESFALIFCGSIPTIKPLWDRIYHGRSFRKSGKKSYDPHAYPHASDHSSRSRKKPKSNLTSILTTDRGVRSGSGGHTELTSRTSDEEYLTQGRGEVRPGTFEIELQGRMHRGGPGEAY